MKSNFLWLGCLYLIFVFIGCRHSRPEELSTGVSQALAEHRKMMIKDLEYRLYFCIPEKQSEQLAGQVKLLFRLERPEDIVLDFREKPEYVKAVEVNGKPVQAIVKNEHILISNEAIKSGKNEIVIDFIAGNQSLNRNEDYLYTLLVPDRARTLFPCFDQPDLKAVFSLELAIPEAWVAVANGAIANEKVEDGIRKITFQPTEPLSTYLFSFVAGRWEKISETRDGRTVSLYHRETDQTKLVQTEIIFDQVFAALQWMEEYTGILYPFTKYDLIVVPGFQFGGMEHPGAVLYNDKRMFLSEHPTIEEELERMELISHETTHMWFGDYVTMVWFNDVWTKEVFANYFASKITEPQFPQTNHQLNALRSFYPAAYSEDRTLGTNAIRQPLDNLNNAGLIYGQIVYNKAPIVLTKLVKLMGEEYFQQGIQEYLQTYAYSNATWGGLIQILDRYTSEDLVAWSHVWVDEKGMPEITANIEGDKLIIRQKDQFGRNIVWPQNVQYALFRKPKDGRSNYIIDTVQITLRDSMEKIAVEPDVEYIIPNIDGNGYGYFFLDSVTASWCLQNLSLFENPVTRLSVMMTLNENRLNGHVQADCFTKAIGEHLRTESEPLVYTAAIGYIKDACLRNQMGRNPETEHLLWELVQRQAVSNDQKIAFRALMDIWTLPESTEKIFQLWERKKNNYGLELSEREEMKMAYELAIRMPERYEEIIEKQLQRISNPDRSREFEFVAQAVNPNETVRDSLFESLLKAENRQIEPWVQQIMYYLNHPLRECQSVKYILPALENLPEIQRTGDIFFPKNWISTCLSGHNSVEAAKIVREFLDKNPNYSFLLRNKILQSADHLYRK